MPSRLAFHVPKVDLLARVERLQAADAVAPSPRHSGSRTGGRYELPLIAVRGTNRFGLLQTLRTFPHARSVYLFGDELHYTDDRAGTSPQTIAGEVRDYLVAQGHPDASTEPISAGIEESFMALMGAAPAATAA